MAGETQTHASRRKSLPRALLSRTFAAHGFALHGMVLDEAALEPETQPIGFRTRVVVRATEPLDLEEVGRREGGALGHLPPGTLFIHNGFVFPRHRGREVLLQLLAEFWPRGRAAGLHSALRVVDRANAPALAAVPRPGVRFRSAPILKLPGLDPLLLGARSMRRSKA